MALTARGFGLLSLAVTAVLLPLLRRSEDRRGGDTTLAAVRLELLSWQRYQVRTAIRALEARDSARSFAATLRPGASRPQAGFSGFGAGIDASGVSSGIDQVWGEIAAPDPSARVGALFMGIVLGSERQVGTGYSGTFIRLDDGGAVCIAIIPAQAGPSGALEMRRSSAERGLAPCALIATFGSPGPTLRSWLGPRHWDAAGSMKWLTGRSNYEFGPWQPTRDPVAFLGPLRMPFLSIPGVREIVWSRTPDYAMGASPLRCLDGATAACAAAVIDTSLVASATPPAPAELSGLPSVMLSSRLDAARPLAGGWLSDLIEAFGRERFARFWTSDAPFEDAFRSAFGEDLGIYQYRWARARWDDTYGRRHGADIVLGVTLPRTTPLLVVIWSAAALALAGWRASLRTMEP